MYVIRKDTGEELFRGSASGAKSFYGNGKKLIGRIAVPDESGEIVEVDPGKEVDLELCYEGTTAEMRLYLTDTDWYVTREQETGKPMPTEVKIRRAAIREAL